MNLKARTKNPLTYWFSLPGWQKILVGLLSGVVVGILLGPNAKFFQPLGALFINAIHMMITPVVFTAIVGAVLSMKDGQKLRRVGIKTIVFYAACMFMASTIGLTVATFIQPGSGLQPMTGLGDSSTAVVAVPKLGDMLANIIPANPVNAFATGNILQILVFAVIVGIAINLAGEKAKPVADFFKAFAQVAFKLSELVMKFAPYGIFALMAWITGKFGIETLLPLIKLLGCMYLCCLLHMLIVYCLSLAIIVRLNPINFFKGIIDALLMAFSSTSSTATLPTTMRCAEENLGISKSITSFLLPLGTSLNLNGLSIYLSVATIFAANMYGIHLSLMQYLTVMVSIVVTSMGAGGVPGSAIIVISAVMSSIGLPLGAVPLVAGVDRIMDMASTTTNVAGDAFAALVIAKSENELDMDVYNQVQHEEAVKSAAKLNYS